jgi:CubicO group peptidase (beta-lactamase class C family)
MRQVVVALSSALFFFGCPQPESNDSPDDGGQAESDAGEVLGDGGSAVNDAGHPPSDAGPSPAEAGVAAPDGGTNTPDANTSVADGGVALPDAGVVGLDAGSTANDAGGCDSAAAEAVLVAALTAATSEVDFSLLLKTESGRAFTYNHGASTPQTSYESASSSKWIAALTILRLVDTGVLSLTDRPQDYIDFWTTDAGSPLSQITLDQLLSFTSGLEVEALCTSVGVANFENCISTLHDNNLAMPVAPGTEYHYGPVHLQVAGLMAVKAAGKASWTEVFTDFQNATGLFPNGAFDLPSANNPRLAGGMHWTGEEYLDFLQAVVEESLLSPGLSTELSEDRIAGLAISASPANAVGRDWHYAWGHWLECDSPIFDCTTSPRLSSPGAYGAYPFIDPEFGYFGILARQGALGTFMNGLNTFESVKSEVEAWARCE